MVPVFDLAQQKGEWWGQAEPSQGPRVRRLERMLGVGARGALRGRICGP